MHVLPQNFYKYFSGLISTDDQAPKTLFQNRTSLTALKGSHFNFCLLFLQLVLCRVAALKSLPVHHP